MNWVEHHGFECLLICFVFALMTSVMPPLPVGKGFWITWLYNVIQLAGANAGNLVKHSPYAEQFQKLSNDSTTKKPDGTQTDTHLELTSTIPKS